MSIVLLNRIVNSNPRRLLMFHLHADVFTRVDGVGYKPGLWSCRWVAGKPPMAKPTSYCHIRQQSSLESRQIKIRLIGLISRLAAVLLA